MKRLLAAGLTGAVALVAAFLPITATATATADTAPVAVVAAENFYGDLARQIGGNDVAVTSILSNPDQDPHTFEASPSTARALAAARIVIVNGAGYDPWMDNLLGASTVKGRAVIAAAALMHRTPKDNPHLWYDPTTMPAVARALADALAAADPAHRAAFERRLDTFLASLAPISRQVADLRATYAGTQVTATEPVFGYMAEAAGLRMRNTRFQWAVMNGTEPAAADVAALENDLRRKTVRVFFYNRQATSPTAQRLMALARSNGIPVVGVSETEPAGTTYQAWMLGQLKALSAALAGKAS